jgi:hypothetical protein
MTTWRKNEPTASRRECAIQVFKDGAPCPRGEDLMATEVVYFRGANSPDADFATGTMTNLRRGLAVADKNVEAVDTAADTLKFTAHGLETGDGPFTIANTGGALPTGITAATNYWLVKSDDDKVQIATSLANAYASPPVVVDITSAGSGVNTLSDTPTTQRGIDGRFVYRATQTEVNHDNCESEVFVDSGTGGSFSLAEGSGGSAYVTMGNDASDWSGLLEGDITRDDALRILLRTHAAKINKTGNDYVIRDLADSKDSHHGTATETGGRTSAGIDDPT